MDEEEKEIEKTSLYSIDDFEDSLVSTTLKEVCMSLREKGYNEINQLVGYIMSGDPGYISSHNDARNKIISIASILSDVFHLFRTRIINIC